MALNSDNDVSASDGNITKPFQRIDFLVRDWANFDDDDDSDEDDSSSATPTPPNYAKMESAMDAYLQEVIKERDAKDLAETRQQITSCFDKVGCYLLTHPGLVVTKKKYDGSADSIEPAFFGLLDRYCDKVFNARLEPKRIHGRHLTATELGEYIKAYASMFKGGAEFPKATTMLAATAEANNNNAKVLAVGKYKAEMDRNCGPTCASFLQAEEFTELHNATSSAAVEVFDHMATFGAEASIEAARGVVVDSIAKEKKSYHALNESRNPLSGIETYLLPLAVGFVSWVLRSILDLTCSGWSTTCKAGSDLSGQIFGVLLLFFIIVAATKAQLIKQRVEMLMKVININTPAAAQKVKAS
jgi:atlastin